MKKTFRVIFAVAVIVLLRLIVSFSVNSIVISDYKKQIYDSKLVKILYVLNFNQPYVAYYNEGNILYNLEEYEKAIKKYEKALEKQPPQKKICSIRVNLSLSIIKSINSTDYNEVYNQLESAKNNLYNNNCASPIDDSGYSKKAKQLEIEIIKLEEKLNNQTTNNGQTTEEEDPKESKVDDSTIEAKLKEIEKNAYSNRQEDLTISKELGDYSYYSGKRW